jgi:uncharacterized protein
VTLIDTHIHVTPPRLPGAGILSPLLDGPIDHLASALRQEMQEAGVDKALGMGCLGSPDSDPLGVASTLEVAGSVPGLYAIGVADPRRGDADHLQRAATALGTGRVKALKGYLGYLHCGPEHAGYRPYYELAARFKVPFIFHTGDTFSAKAKLRFAHPLLVDDVAVDHPDVHFVLAHLGNPWLIEAAEVVYKNVKVWVDLSGLIVGDRDSFADEERREMLLETRTSVAKAFRYAERPNRFLYGSDWPLAPMACYRDFIRLTIPDVYHDQVFTDNALALFRF